jgi:hypothetical protein
MTDSNKNIDFRINGLDEDQGDVRLTVFKDKISQLSALMSDAERQAANVGQAKSLYRLTGLEHSSAIITFEPYAEDGYRGSEQGIELIKNVLDGLHQSAVEIASNVQSSIYKKIQKLCLGSGERFKSQTLTLDGRSYVFDNDLFAKAQKYLDKTYQAFGTIKGTIERINIHDRKEFIIYLDVTGEGVECHFKGDETLNIIKSALGERVLAYGKLDYIGGDVDPYKAMIEEIEVAPKGYSIPDLNVFLGKEPKLTGDDDTLTYIRRIRDEWERH